MFIGWVDSNFNSWVQSLPNFWVVVHMQLASICDVGGNSAWKTYCATNVPNYLKLKAAKDKKKQTAWFVNEVIKPGASIFSPRGLFELKLLFEG